MRRPWLFDPQPDTHQIINAGCYNLGRLNGTQICVSAPGTPFVPPPTTVLAPMTPTSPAATPTNVASGSNTYCGKWYDVQAGDYCNSVILKFGVSLQDFIFLNPAVNENCTNLYAHESYCVKAVGDSEYSTCLSSIQRSFSTSRAD
jgi:hypothetical protein